MSSFLPNDCGKGLYQCEQLLGQLGGKAFSFTWPPPHHTKYIPYTEVQEPVGYSLLLHCRLFNAIACNTLFIDMKKHLKPNYIAGNGISLNRCRAVRKKFGVY